MTYLTEKQFDRIKMSLKLAEIGEVIRSSGYSHDTVKWVDASPTYEEYESMRKDREAVREKAFEEESIKAANGYVWVRPKTITDLWNELRANKEELIAIREIVERLDLKH